MATIFNDVLYRPIFNLAIFLYNIIPTHDFGVAIVLLTVLVRVVFMPLSIKAIKSQRALNSLGPKINELKEKYKSDSAAQSAAIMKLYKDSGVNPLAGCLPLLIQLPILIALYKVFSSGVNIQNLDALYSFIARPEVVNKMFLGFLDITVKSPVLAVIAGGLQFIQSKQQAGNMKNPESGATKEISALNKQMLYFFPAFIIIIGWNLPAGLTLYWVAATAFSIFEQIYIRRRHS